MKNFLREKRRLVVTCVFTVTLLFLALSSVYAAIPGEGHKIYNPLERSGINDIPTLVSTIVDQVANVGYFVIVFFILYSGFLFVTARGDEAGLKKAKEVFLWTVIGAAVLLGAKVLSAVIKGTVNQLSVAPTHIVEKLASLYEKDIVL
jgi:uncharacterized BrkB/YihY/UPF0761 family membrane protein